MKNKMITGFIGAVIFLTSNLCFSTTYQLSPNLSLDLDFPPNEKQIFSNFFFWTLRAQCVVHTQGSISPFTAKITKKHGEVNGTKLDTNEPIYLSVKDEDILNISAAPGAEVELLNLGVKNISARCST